MRELAASPFCLSIEPRGFGRLDTWQHCAFASLGPGMTRLPRTCIDACIGAGLLWQGLTSTPRWAEKQDLAQASSGNGGTP